MRTLDDITNLDEESHHVEELLNADVAIAILIKQIEHLKKSMKYKITVVVTKTRLPFSYNFEVFFDKSAKYWAILPSKITLETTDQAQSV